MELPPRDCDLSCPPGRSRCAGCCGVDDRRLRCEKDEGPKDEEEVEVGFVSASLTRLKAPEGRGPSGALYANEAEILVFSDWPQGRGTASSGNSNCDLWLSEPRRNALGWLFAEGLVVSGKMAK